MKHSVRLMLALAALLAFAAASAQERPPLKLVVGFPPGAVLDTMSRLVADKLKVSLGRSVIVDNKPGAAGMIGAEFTKAASPDGNTYLVAPVANISIAPHSTPNLRYNPLTDFEPVAHLADFQIGFAINDGVGARSLKEYVALVKKDSKAGNFASSASGSLPHFFGLLVARTAGIEMTHVPYRGTAPAIVALSGGEIPAGVFALPDLSAMIATGKIRLLATSGAGRSLLYPATPTFRESGFDIQGNGWYALYAPAKTPRSGIDAVSKAAIEAINSPDLQPRFTALGLEPTGYGPDETRRIVRADYDKWGPVIRASGFKADQ
jgi:tripartite-type tricarboxylate transporter receptor subunit TctC